jgi:hypothetical protein
LTEIETATQADTDDVEFHAHTNGEMADSHSLTAVNLAHKAVHKFPDLVKRHQKLVGTAAVLSSAVVVFASIAITKRLHKGESPEQILESITSEEIESMASERTENPHKPRRGLKRILPK